MYLFSFRMSSFETDRLTRPFVEKVRTSDNLEGLETVSFFEGLKRLNFAKPNVLPASEEYVMIGTGIILKRASAFLLKWSNFDNVSFCGVKFNCAEAKNGPARKSKTTTIFPFGIISNIRL